jgi:hypothetical protein
MGVVRSGRRSDSFGPISVNDIANDNAYTSSVSRLSLLLLYLCGVAVSTVAAISFIQHVAGLDLIPIYAHWLSVCRGILNSIVTGLYAPFVLIAERVVLWFQFPLQISIPEWWKDLVALSTLNAAANLRGSIVMRGGQLSLTQTIGYIVAIWIYGLTLLGLVLFAIPLLAISLIMPPNDAEDRAHSRLLWSVWRPYLLSLLAIGALTAAFFITNEYSLKDQLIIINGFRVRQFFGSQLIPSVA